MLINPSWFTGNDLGRLFIIEVQFVCPWKVTRNIANNRDFVCELIRLKNGTSIKTFSSVDFGPSTLFCSLFVFLLVALTHQAWRILWRRSWVTWWCLSGGLVNTGENRDRLRVYRLGTRHWGQPVLCPGSDKLSSPAPEMEHEWIN